MPKFCANLTMMYNEFPFLERFGAAAKDGFQGVEFLFPYEYAAADIKSRLDAVGLQQILFNCPPGDWKKGERGIAALPGRQEEFRRGVAQALEYAVVLGTKRLHVMAGLLSHTHARAEQHAIFCENLGYAARQAAAVDVTVLIEPINVRDMPGYFLTGQTAAHTICKEIGARNLKVQMDLYHCQIMEGDLAMTMRANIAGIGHMQIAGTPGRREPDIGEINYPYLFALMDQLEYDGWVGCEYKPQAGTSDGLSWFAPYAN